MQSEEKERSPFQTIIPNKWFPFPSLCVMSHHPPHTCTLTSTFFPAWPAQHFHPHLPPVEEKRQTPTMGSLMLQDFIYFFTLNPEFYSVGGIFVLFWFFFTPELVCLLIQLCFTDVQHKGLCSFQAHLSLACRGWRAIKFSACGLSSLRASQIFINSAPQRLGAQLHPSCLGRLRPGGLSEVKE